MNAELSEAALPLLVDLVLKGMVTLALVLPLLFLLRQRSAALRHGLLTGVFLLLLLAPALAIILPDLVLPVLPAAWFGEEPMVSIVDSVSIEYASIEFGEIVPVESEPQPQQIVLPDWRELALWTWLAGAAAVAAWLIAGQVRVRQLVRRSMTVERCPLCDRAEEIALEQNAGLRWRLLLSDEAPVPLVIGLRRPAVVLPADAVRWPAQRLEMALRHEFAHIARRDMIWQLPALLGTVLFWFNPLAWHAAQRQMREREQACDDDVLRAGFRPSEYAEHLLETARNLSRGSMLRWAAIGMARGADFKVRMKAILSPRLDRSPLTPGRAFGVALLCCALILPVAAWRPWETTAPADERSIPGEVPLAVGVPGTTDDTRVVNTSFGEPVHDLSPGLGNAGIAYVDPSNEQELVYEAGKDGIKEPKLILRIEPDYPPSAKAAKVEGRVVVSAVIGTDGSIEEVQVVEESTPGYGFAESAIVAVKRWKFEPTLVDGKAVRVRIKFATEFNLAPDRDDKQVMDLPKDITGNLAIVKPTVILNGPQPFPAKAKTERIAGRATLRLIIRKDGSWELERVLNETPPGYGFAEAALEYLTSSTWEPARENGVPIDVYFDLTIVFNLKNDPADAAPVEVAGDVVKPEVTFTKMQPFPARAKEERVAGRAKLRLIIRKDGTWELERILYETPPDYGFANAALEYLKASEWKPATKNGEPIDVYFELTIVFNLKKDTASAGPVEMSADITPPSVQFMNAQPLPQKARILKRGGLVKVRLIVRKNGVWELDRLISEAPTDFGFADAAVEYLQSSVWKPATRNGVPVDVYFELTIMFNNVEKPAGTKDIPYGDVLLTAGTGGDVPTPEVVHRVEPIYPERAKREGIEGAVQLTLLLELDGTVREASMTNEEPGGYGFADAALAAVKQWRFAKTVVKGRPVRVKTALTVKFDLKAKGGASSVAEQAWDTPPQFDHYTRMVMPEMTNALRKGWELRYRLEIDATGAVRSIEIAYQKPVNSSLAEAFRRNLANAVWQPALKNGVPVAATFEYTTRFTGSSRPLTTPLPFADTREYPGTKPAFGDPEHPDR